MFVINYQCVEIQINSKDTTLFQEYVLYLVCCFSLNSLFFSTNIPNTQILFSWKWGAALIWYCMLILICWSPSQLISQVNWMKLQLAITNKGKNLRDNCRQSLSAAYHPATSYRRVEQDIRFWSREYCWGKCDHNFLDQPPRTDKANTITGHQIVPLLTLTSPKICHSMTLSGRSRDGSGASFSNESMPGKRHRKFKSVRTECFALATKRIQTHVSNSGFIFFIPSQ